MNMPSELKAAIEAAHGGPLEIVDGDQRYVLVRAELYQKLQAVMDDGPKFALQEMGR